MAIWTWIVTLCQRKEITFTQYGIDFYSSFNQSKGIQLVSTGFGRCSAIAVAADIRAISK